MRKRATFGYAPPRSMTSRSWRAGGAVVLVLGVMLGVPVSAFGADQTPIITTSGGGKDALEFTTKDDISTSTLTVTNPAGAPITLTMTGLGDLAECTDWDLTPTSIAADRTTSVEVKTGCTIPESGQVVLTAVPGGNIATLEVTAKDPAPTVALGTILRAFAIAGVVALVAAWLLWTGRPVVRKLATRPDPPTPPPANDPWADPWDDEKGTYNEALFPEIGKAGRTEELPGVDAKWSFTDSWATSVSTIGTLVVALLAASDVLTALLGDKPEAFLANVLVAGAIAAFFTGAAPLVTKAVGKSTKPCVGGVLAGGVLTMTGVAGQLWVVGWQFGSLAIAERVPAFLRGALPYVLGAAIVAYGFATLRLLLREAFANPVDRPAMLSLDQATILAVEVVPEGSGEQDILDKAKEIRKALALDAIGVKPDLVLTSIPSTSPRRSLLAPVMQAETSAIL